MVLLRLLIQSCKGKVKSNEINLKLLSKNTSVLCTNNDAALQNSLYLKHKAIASHEPPIYWQPTIIYTRQ